MATERQIKADRANAALPMLVSGVLGLQHPFEAAYARQYNRAFAKLLKLREKLAGEPKADDFLTEANFEAGSGPILKGI